ncbi:MAG: OmpA family protein, partial [Candidatus Omnitrophota bacterium]
DKDKQIAKLQEQLSADAKQIEKINSAYAAQVESLNKEILKNNSQLKESAQKIIDLKDSQVLLEQTKKESSQKAANYETKIKDLEKSLTKLQTQVNDDAKIIMKLNSDLVARSDSFKSEVLVNDVKVRDLEVRLAKQVSENEDYLKSLREKIAESQMDLAALKNESGSLAAIQDNTQLEAAKWTVELKDIKAKMQKDLQQEINDHKIKLDLSKQGIVVSVLSDVLFDSGSDVIKPESMKMLNKIADALSQTIKDNQIIIEGHTDNEPIKHSGWKSNWELSSVRAIAVLNYFTRDCGLGADRFVVNAYGEFRPVANNDTKEGKGKNRRVEIIVLPFKIIKVKADKQ